MAPLKILQINLGCARVAHDLAFTIAKENEPHLILTCEPIKTILNRPGWISDNRKISGVFCRNKTIGIKGFTRLDGTGQALGIPPTPYEIGHEKKLQIRKKLFPSELHTWTRNVGVKEASPFTMEELDIASSKMKAGNHSGLDGVLAKTIKLAVKNTPTVILEIMNYPLTCQRERLTAELSAPIQFGFRKGRLTTQATKGGRRCCVFITLDVKNASSNAGSSIIINKLRKIGMRPFLVNVEEANFCGQTLEVRGIGVSVGVS
ncbi:hypothetical protein JTB14_034869 [Gonioctena quinquepunctata]|nr:hypothetical protein JTB14_034869 [Gonioctena quinquepunctata]